MASMAPLDLEITVISAKHLKNVNWRNGDLKPYAVSYIDSSDNRLATHSDDSGNTSPVWNERFTIPVTRSLNESVLVVEIFHSRPSETPKPLVGTAKVQLSQFIDESRELSNSIHTIVLLRPSGRPHGKVRVKMALKERKLPAPVPPPSDYSNAPQLYNPYYLPPPLKPPVHIPVRDYREFSSAPYYLAADSSYSGYYGPPQPPMPSWPLYHRASSYSPSIGPSAPADMSSSTVAPPPPPKASNFGLASGPSAPVDFSLSASYDPKLPFQKVGMVTSSSAFGRMSLEEGSGHEKEKTAEEERKYDNLRDYHGFHGRNDF